MIDYSKTDLPAVAKLVAAFADPMNKKVGWNNVTLIGKDFDALSPIRGAINSAYRKMFGEESPIAFTLIAPGCMNDLTEVHIFGALDLAQTTPAQRDRLATWVQHNSHLMVHFVEVHDE